MFKDRKKGIVTPLTIVVSVLAILSAEVFLETPIQKTEIKTIDTEQKNTEEKQIEELSGLNLKTTKLSTVPEGYKFSEMVFSPDGHRVAYHVTKDSDDFIIIDDELSCAYDHIEDIVFSPDSKQMVYSARNNEKCFMVVNSEKKKEYRWVRDPVFSPDSKQLAYVAAEENGNYFVVVNNRENAVYDWVNSPIFSADSKKLAYAAQKNEKRFVVINGEEGKHYDGIQELIFSPDSKRLAYNANSEFMVVDDKEGKQYHLGGVSSPIFSPDSQKIAYSASNKVTDFTKIDDANDFMVVNNDEKKYYNDNAGNYWVGGPVFSPDSERLAYIAEQDDRFFLVLNDEEGKTHDYAITPVFSPDSKRLAYIAGKRDVGEKTGRFFVVADEKEEQIYHSMIMGLVFSPDSKNLAYIALREISSKEIECTVVVNGKEGKKYDLIGDIFSRSRNSIFFSSDSKYIAYGAKLGDELWWIVDEISGGLAQQDDITSQEQLSPNKIGQEAEWLKDPELVEQLGKEGMKCEYRKGEYIMSIYDSEGRVTGLVNGEVKEEIPKSIFDTESNQAIIFDPVDSYTYEFLCVKEGNYQFTETFNSVEQRTLFSAVNIPMLPDQIHRYYINWNDFEQDKDAVVLMVDNNGDGVFEKTMDADSELTCEEFISELAQ